MMSADANGDVGKVGSVDARLTLGRVESNDGILLSLGAERRLMAMDRIARTNSSSSLSLPLHPSPLYRDDSDNGRSVALLDLVDRTERAECVRIESGVLTCRVIGVERTDERDEVDDVEFRRVNREFGEIIFDFKAASTSGVERSGPCQRVIPSHEAQILPISDSACSRTTGSSSDGTGSSTLRYGNIVFSGSVVGGVHSTVTPAIALGVSPSSVTTPSLVGLIQCCGEPELEHGDRFECDFSGVRSVKSISLSRER